MISRQLNWLQVAALLVSASYGVGFLFDSGELPGTRGMAGTLYPWLTALGMALLAVFAGRVWSAGVAVWDMLGDMYGASVKNQVALLSVIWMTGVLAAQIHGGVAVLQLCAMPSWFAFPVMLALIFVASRLELRAASKAFELCVLASSLVLVFSLHKIGGGKVYLDAIPQFTRDVRDVRAGELSTMTLAIVFLVITGADYQQFIIAAQGRLHAILGCGLAAVCLLIVGPLPASAAVAANHSGLLAGMGDARQAIPMILASVSPKVGHGWAVAMLMALLGAALGSAAAMIRAMTSASIGCRAEGAWGRACVSLAIVLLGGVIASRDKRLFKPWWISTSSTSRVLLRCLSFCCSASVSLPYRKMEHHTRLHCCRLLLCRQMARHRTQRHSVRCARARRA